MSKAHETLEASNRYIFRNEKNNGFRFLANGF